ncbi:unnamed protein product [Adineta ricciae]|uniref:F-box domain-containing protein n=1 Tax=Adineta ricciae TaxID=249248 RepID=A0A815WDV0_ADIRI|nr:unnamed protein product [Adineta ricciae]
MDFIEPIIIIFGSIERISRLNFNIPVTLKILTKATSLAQSVNVKRNSLNTCCHRYFVILLDTIENDLMTHLQATDEVLVIYLRELINPEHKQKRLKRRTTTRRNEAKFTVFFLLSQSKDTSILDHAIYNEIESAQQCIQEICKSIGFESIIIHTISHYFPNNENEFILRPDLKILFDNADWDKIYHILKSLAPIRLYLYGNEHSIENKWSNLMISTETRIMANEDDWCALVNKEPLDNVNRWAILAEYSSTWQIKRVSSINLFDFEENLAFHSALRQAHITFNERKCQFTNHLFNWYENYVNQSVFQTKSQLTSGENITINLRNLHDSTQQPIRQSQQSLLKLPVELLHRILDDVDTMTILRGLRCVCTKLYSVVNSFNRYKLDSTSLSSNDIKLIHQLIQPENIISLHLISDNRSASNKIDLLHSRFNISQFTKLRSLALHSLVDNKLEKFLQNVNCSSLISLSIRLNDVQSVRVESFLIQFLTKSTLRKLYLCADEPIHDRIFCRMGHRLEYLKVNQCTFTQYFNLLQYLPHLRTFSMEKCIIKQPDRLQMLKSDNQICHHQMESVSIEECQLTMDNLLLITTLTPSLIHLKIVSNISDTDAFTLVTDVSRLEEFVQSQLPRLRKFEFFFSFERNAQNEMISLDSFVTPFRTSYWLNDKHWVVASAYVMNDPEIWLYTLPICVQHRMTKPMYEISSVDNDGHLIINYQHDYSHISQENKDEQTGTALNLHFCRVKNEGARYIAHTLRLNQTITQLDLEECFIGLEGIRYLSDALRENTTLKTLNLSGNSICDDAILFLAESLLYNAILVTLNLGWNQIRNNGLRYLTDVLKQNKTLEALDLRWNSIGYASAPYLIDALGRNTTLVILILWGNQIFNGSNDGPIATASLMSWLCQGSMNN